MRKKAVEEVKDVMAWENWLWRWWREGMSMLVGGGGFEGG